MWTSSFIHLLIRLKWNEKNEKRSELFSPFCRAQERFSLYIYLMVRLEHFIAYSRLKRAAYHWLVLSLCMCSHAGKFIQRIKARMLKRNASECIKDHKSIHLFTFLFLAATTHTDRYYAVFVLVSLPLKYSAVNYIHTL